MEDSTSSTLQDIEKLKHKISSYRDTLMTLKMGTSLEDYLIMKNEFETLKKQISFIEGLTQTMDEKQQTQNVVYEEQIKQFSLQLEEIKDTVKEMNQEILTILNQISSNKNEDDSEKDSSTSNITHVMQSSDNQSSTISNQPSYKQLRNLTNQVLQPQRNQDSIASFEQTGFIGDQKDQRYFNQHYFQSINTHPNYTYNNLYKNTGKTPLNIKNTDEVQNSPTNNIETNMLPSIDKPTRNVNTTVLTPINTNSDSSNEIEASYNDSKIENQIHSQTVEKKDKADTETGSLNNESKKQKNSTFFNIFRK